MNSGALPYTTACASNHLNRLHPAICFHKTAMCLQEQLIYRPKPQSGRPESQQIWPWIPAYTSRSEHVPKHSERKLLWRIVISTPGWRNTNKAETVVSVCVCVLEPVLKDHAYLFNNERITVCNTRAFDVHQPLLCVNRRFRTMSSLYWRKWQTWESDWCTFSSSPKAWKN